MKNYMKMVEEEEKEAIFFLGMWEKLSSNSSSYEMWSLFGFLIVINWGQKSLWTFFSLELGV